VRIPVDLHPRKAIGDGRRRRRDAAFTRELTDAQQQTPRAIVRHEEANAPLSIQLNQFMQAGDGGALAGARLEVPKTLIGRPSLPANNFAELRTWLNANKGKVNLANAGLGAASHLCGLLFMNALQFDMTTVPYKGTAPAMTDLIGGQVDLVCDQTTNTTAQIEGKKVKAYAVTSVKRLTTPGLKDLPTLQEAGLKGFEVTIWHGVYAPKRTPPEALKKINDAIKAAMKDPDFIKKQEALGAVLVSDKRIEPAEHKKFVAAEIARWGPIIRAAGVYAD
jgi:tripartite-type tricarboxylate transporter receptor subunit TctC